MIRQCSRNAIHRGAFTLSLLFCACFALMRTDGWAQDAAVVVSEFVFDEVPFPSCHASTVVQASDGTIVIAWFGGKYEKSEDVGIWISRKGSDGWTSPVEVANGVQFRWTEATDLGGARNPSVQRYPTWNPVLFQPSAGPLMLFYKAGPSPQSWWGMVTTSADQGVSWSEPVRLPEGILGPIKNKPIELEDGSILCPTSHETDDGSDLWTVYFERLSVKDRTWSRTKPLNDPRKIGAIQPSVLKLGGNRLAAIGRTQQGYVFQMESSDLGNTWSEMKLTSLPNPNSGTDAITLRDGRHLLVYNHATKKSGEWGGERSPLNVAISTDGSQWTSVLELENEPNQEFSYPAVIQAADDTVHIAYTWKRQKIKHVVLRLK